MINPITGKPYLGIPSLSAEQTASFLNPGAIRATDLQPKTQLWRFNPLRDPRRFSAFWMTEETMRQVMSIITSRLAFSKAAKREIVKTSFAVLDKFGTHKDKSHNQQDDDIREMAAWRMRIILKSPVHAFIGQSGPQKDMRHNPNASAAYGADTHSIFQARLGGFEQVVIPEFAGKNEGTASPFASINYLAEL